MTTAQQLEFYCIYGLVGEYFLIIRMKVHTMLLSSPFDITISEIC